MFPPQVITFIVTFILRALVDKWMQAGEDRRMEKAMDREWVELEVESQNNIRAQIPKLLFGWTTAILAIMAFSCIIGVRIVGPLFFDVPVYFAFSETSPGFLFLLEPTEKIQYLELPGITFLPSDSHLLSAIAGAFFGRIRR
tara:strand:- start:15 stop:440 length:426 start_codon:yes stop_codon:yes gene_type:complete